MTEAANKEFVRRYLDALREDKSSATLDTFIAEDELKQHITLYEASFPGYRIEADDMVAEGDRVAVRGTIHGIHQGELMGIQPTGKAVAVSLFIIYRIADGKIVEHWMLADVMGLLQQLGAAPGPTHA